MELEFHQLSTKYSALRLMLPGQKGRLMASLAEEGQLHPVSVVAAAELGESYVLIDGYRRVGALKALGRDVVKAVELPLSETEGLIFRHHQLGTRRNTALEDGWLYRDLIENHGMNQADLSRRLLRSESWVSRRLALVRELPESIQDKVRRGSFCDYTAMRFLVPLARAKKSDCESLVENLGGRRISTRQMERLYMSWKRGDGELRRKIVENPSLFLKTLEELNSVPPSRKSDSLGPICDDLEILAAVSGRAKNRLRQSHGKGTIPTPILDAWRGARACFDGLRKQMEKRLNAGSGNENSRIAPER